MKTALAMKEPDWSDSEPTPAELAAIEAEWPAIAADLAGFARWVEFDAAAFADLDVSGVDFSRN